MNYAHHQLIEELAAQYVLGTLRGPARRRFERICESDPSAVLAVHRWEDRLFSLLSEVAPVTPSSLAWERVRLRIRRETAASRKAGNTKRQTLRFAIAAGIAAFALAIGWWNWLGPASSELLAVVTSEQQANMWRIEARADREALVIDANENLVLDATRAYELWALPGPNAAPVSLGLLPRTGRSTLELSESQRAALARSAQVAISLEPPGGSPTGAPTGPVLYVAEIVGG
jgi:anti-sigma-K factor RskA